MKKSVLVALLVVALLGASLAPQAHAQGWETLIPAVVKQIASLWGRGDVQILGHPCRYRVRPRIKRWQLYYKGTVSCPGWTSITGSVTTRSRSKVAVNTITDFVQKAVKAGLINESNAKQFLQK